MNTNLCMVERPKIALVTDRPDWVFSNIAKQLQQHLGDKYDFSVIPKGIITSINQIFLITRQFDLVHFFWRGDLAFFDDDTYKEYFNEAGIHHMEFYNEVIKFQKITTAVYDHLFLETNEIYSKKQIFNEIVSAYYVCSERLMRIYQDISDYKKPLMILEDGVDLSTFYPLNISRLEHFEKREIVIGWSGNSKWNSQVEDFKGLHTILKPAIRQLAAEGFQVRLLCADRAYGMIPHKEMVHYYSQIDIYVCPSKIEGTPNPVLEAMACGIPVITTDVGVVPEAFGSLQQQFILKERTIDCLKKALIRLISSPDLARELSQENLIQIQPWDWKYKCANFDLFFDSILKQE